MSTVNRPADVVRCAIHQVFETHGLSSNDATLVTDCLMEAELRGRATHGLLRIASLAKHTAKVGGGQLTIAEQGPGWSVVDGGGGLGYVSAARSMDHAVEQAQQTGTHVAMVRNGSHCGMIGYYAERASREGLVGLVMVNCRPIMAPHGSNQALFGTNPIAFSVPTDNHPLTFDMATSAITYGDALFAEHAGHELSPDVAFDSTGAPTRDPVAARADGALCPVAGHKGSGLALMVQILTGVLSGAAAIPQRGSNYAYFMLALDPARWLGADKFADETRALLDALRSAPEAEAGVEVRVPGDRAWRERARRLEEGLTIDEELWTTIVDLGGGQA